MHSIRCVVNTGVNTAKVGLKQININISWNLEEFSSRISFLSLIFFLFLSFFEIINEIHQFADGSNNTLNKYVIN